MIEEERGRVIIIIIVFKDYLIKNIKFTLIGSFLYENRHSLD
jgi:hypothetical protein